MRLTLKLLLALTVATVVILGVGSLLRLRRELDLFATDSRRDDEFIARVLARSATRGRPAASPRPRRSSATPA